MLVPSPGKQISLEKPVPLPFLPNKTLIWWHQNLGICCAIIRSTKLLSSRARDLDQTRVQKLKILTLIIWNSGPTCLCCQTLSWFPQNFSPPPTTALHYCNSMLNQKVNTLKWQHLFSLAWIPCNVSFTIILIFFTYLDKARIWLESIRYWKVKKRDLIILITCSWTWYKEFTWQGMQKEILLQDPWSYHLQTLNCEHHHSAEKQTNVITNATLLNL